MNIDPTRSYFSDRGRKFRGVVPIHSPHVHAHVGKFRKYGTFVPNKLHFVMKILRIWFGEGDFGGISRVVACQSLSGAARAMSVSYRGCLEARKRTGDTGVFMIRGKGGFWRVRRVEVERVERKRGRGRRVDRPAKTGFNF